MILVISLLLSIVSLLLLLLDGKELSTHPQFEMRPK
jgi:hypothetical protein